MNRQTCSSNRKIIKCDKFSSKTCRSAKTSQNVHKLHTNSESCKVFKTEFKISVPFNYDQQNFEHISVL